MTVPPELFAQAPILGLIVVLVFGFLKYVQERDKADRENQARLGTIIERNTEILGRVLSVMDRALIALTVKEQAKESRS